MNFKQPKVTEKGGSNGLVGITIVYKPEEKRYTLNFTSAFCKKARISDGNTVAVSLENNKVLFVFNPSLETPTYIIRGYSASKTLRITNKDLITDIVEVLGNIKEAALVVTGEYEGNIVYSAIKE